MLGRYPMWQRKAYARHVGLRSLRYKRMLATTKRNSARTLLAMASGMVVVVLAVVGLHNAWLSSGAAVATAPVTDMVSQIAREGARLGPAVGGWLAMDPARGKAILQQTLPTPVETGLEQPPLLSWQDRLRSWIYMALDLDITQPKTLLTATLPHPAATSLVVVRVPDGTHNIDTPATPPVTVTPVQPVEGKPAPAAQKALTPGAVEERITEALADVKYTQTARLTTLAQADWGSQPLVLIFHTHTSEMYRTSDFTPTSSQESHRFNSADTGVVRVGEVLARTLSERYGIPVVHSKAIHDFPSHALAYSSAARTLRALLAKYPSIKVVLDVHRDAAENATYVREVKGTQVSQVMVIVSKLGATKPALHPNWRANVQFAAQMEGSMRALYPGLLRRYPPVNARYNQNLSPNMVLLEFGNYMDDEKYALRSAAMVADAVALSLDWAKSKPASSVREAAAEQVKQPQPVQKTKPQPQSQPQPTALGQPVPPASARPVPQGKRP